jgi:hypothetical protein
MAMQVFFTSQDVEGDKLRDPVVQRVSFVMRRMAWLVPKATVELSDVNGPGSGGGVDKRCLVELKTERVGTVVVTSIARDWHCALDNALTGAIGALRACGQERPQAGR